jgi:hypothetical protein
VDGRALTRLRIAFVLLAAALLAPLALLARSMETRLEAQRRLRHEIVAERIFDEMERELTALLATESARPTDAYKASSTRVEHWAPFVVGYFTRDAAGVHIVAQSQIDGTRSARLLRALGPSQVPPEPAKPAPDRVGVEAPEVVGLVQELAPSYGKLEKKLSRPRAALPNDEAPADKALGERAPAAAILKQLNRGGDEREKVQRKLDSKRRDATRDSSQDDPLADYSW